MRNTSSIWGRKTRIFVTGNTKFDQTYAEVTPEDLQQYKDELGLEEDYPVIVAGSTHPTEEETLFQSFLDIRKEFPQAPSHHRPPEAWPDP